MALVSRVSLGVALAFATAGACSTTYSSTNLGGDASTPSDASTRIDGTSTDANDDGDANADPCLNKPNLAEYAGLYVFGGQNSGVEGSYAEPQDILRAPVHCDGTLGDWVNIGTMPSSNSGFPSDGRVEPVGGFYQNQIVLFGGQTSLGGSPFSTEILDWTVATDGTLGMLQTSQGTAPETELWRAMSTTVGSTLIVAGGENSSDDGGINILGDVTLWDLSGGPTSLGATTRLPIPVARGGAVALGNDVYVFGGVASVGTGGVVSVMTLGDTPPTWKNAGTHPDLDFGLATDGTSLYVAGGEGLPTTLTIYTPGANKSFLTTNTAGLTQSMTLTSATISRGTIYMVGTSAPPYTTVLFAPIEPTNINGIGEVVTGPSLPEARYGCVSFIIPLPP